MDDGELLGLLAAEAPAPRPGLADEVIARARRTRARRRWRAAAGGLALAAAVTAAAPLVLHRPGELQSNYSASEAAPQSDVRPKSEEDQAAPHREPSAVSAPAGANALADEASGTADVYAAVLDALLPDGEAARPLWVLDRVCPLRGECTDRAFDDALKAELAARVPSVRFAEPDGKHARSALLRLGEVRLEDADGRKARVPVSGRLVRLELSEGRWRVVDGL